MLSSAPSSKCITSPAIDAELESARSLFGEKVKELSVAVAKVDALTRQLEELKKGNTSNSYHVVQNVQQLLSTAVENGHNRSCNGSTTSSSSSLTNHPNGIMSSKLNKEFEKLRQELLVSLKIYSQTSQLSSSSQKLDTNRLFLFPLKHVDPSVWRRYYILFL